MKHFNHAFRFLVLMTVITGFIYPGLITGIAKVAFAHQAEGSLIKNSQGQIIGSELIAQDFKGDKYFHPRPSAIDYNPTYSSGSNLGPTSADLLAKVNDRKKSGVTGELLFASGSGLDPHITPVSAKEQTSRVAHARGVDESAIYDMIRKYTEPRQFGFLGEERVNVLKLNLALDASHE